MECSTGNSQMVSSLEGLTPSYSRRRSVHIPRKTSWETPIPPPSSQKGATGDFQADAFDTVGLDTKCGTATVSVDDVAWNTIDNIAALGLSFQGDNGGAISTPKRDRFLLEDVESDIKQPRSLDSRRHFNKLVKHIQRRATQRRKTVSCGIDGCTWEKNTSSSPVIERRSRHKKSSSGSSSAFVTAVKSASISIASFSVAPRSRKTGTPSHHHRADYSGKISHMGRRSEDSSYPTRDIAIDEAVTNRLLQRRRVLEEIITTEESYVADVKFLMNVCSRLISQNKLLSSLIGICDSYGIYSWFVSES